MKYHAYILTILIKTTITYKKRLTPFNPGKLVQERMISVIMDS